MFSSGMFATGKVIGTGSDLVVAGDKCGFKPRSIKVLNATTGVSLFYEENMGTSAAKRAVDGTATFEASYVTLQADGFKLAAAVAADEDEVYYEAIG